MRKTNARQAGYAPGSPPTRKASPSLVPAMVIGRWRDSRKGHTPRLRKEKGKVRNSPQQSDYLGNEDLVAGSHEDLVAGSHYGPSGSGIMVNAVILYATRTERGAARQQFSLFFREP